MRRKFTKKDFKSLFLTLLPSIVCAFKPLVDNFNDKFVITIFVITLMFSLIVAFFNILTTNNFLFIAILIFLFINALVSFCISYMIDNSLLIHEIIFCYGFMNGGFLLFLLLFMILAIINYYLGLFIF